MKTKTLGQIAHAANPHATQSWNEVPAMQKLAYEDCAEAVARHVRRPLKSSHPSRKEKSSGESTRPSHVKQRTSVWSSRELKGFACLHTMVREIGSFKKARIFSIEISEKKGISDIPCRITVEWQEPKKEKK